jgi:hypothetical protein
MDQNPAILIETPLLHKWLGRRLYEKEISKRQLSRLIGRSESQVNHWLSGKERIPLGLFIQAIDAIIPEESEAAEKLLIAHERAKLVQREAAMIVSDDTPASIIATVKVIVRRAEESAALSEAGDAATQYRTLSDNLSAGLNVLNMVKGCKDEEVAFIHENNIQLHLRFPHNVMTSDLIQFAAQNPRCLDEAREKVLRSMRETVKSKNSAKFSDHVRQHAYHMLARCGDPSSRDLVLEITKSCRDLATRRTAHYARIVDNPNPQAAEEFMFELENSVDLATVTLEFDLIHYGDKILGDQTSLKSVENMIVHNLRHIRTHHRAATTQVAFWKLLNILGRFGAQPFDRRRIYPHIRKILASLQILDSVKLTPIERRFLGQFARLQLTSDLVSESPSIGRSQLTFSFK